MNAANERNGEAPRSSRTAARDILELWIALARREWASLVLVPTDRDGSTAEIANALADIGQRLSYGPVTAITVSQLEFGSALALADLQQHIDRERGRWAQPPQPVKVDGDGAAHGRAGTGPGAEPAPGAPSAATRPAEAAQDERAEPDAPVEGSRGSEALVRIPPARIIISIPPVVTEPLGLTAAQEADAVVLAVSMNHSRLPEVKRAIELVGRNRITGCFLVR